MDITAQQEALQELLPLSSLSLLSLSLSFSLILILEALREHNNAATGSPGAADSLQDEKNALLQHSRSHHVRDRLQVSLRVCAFVFAFVFSMCVLLDACLEFSFVCMGRRCITRHLAN